MKKLIVLLAMVMAFTLTSVAQTSPSSSGQTDQTTSGKTKSKSDQGMSDMNMGKSGKAKKEATLTGCLNSDASMLTNGKYKNGVKVGPADKVKEHAGHQVALKGQWSGTGADKNFEVASVKHLSETCSAAKGGGTTGTTKKGKDTGATPKS
ncbi:MAG TPA: hypothetical protein VFI82_11980 [Terriglobales bacterium]|nr:hypothetical protein [Terriglobales bacterium]